MSNLLNNKDILKAMQAMERAYLRREGEKDAVRLEPANPDEAFPSSNYILPMAFKELKNRGLITIENSPGKGEHPTNRHFQFRKTIKFQSIYKQLEKQYPELQDTSFRERLPKKVKCNGLLFYVISGKFQYGKTMGKMLPGSAAWTALCMLLLNKNQKVAREHLEDAIVAEWKRVTGKRKGKSKRSIEIEKEIRNIRRKLKMGKVTDSENKDLIEGGGDGKTYRIICR